MDTQQLSHLIERIYSIHEHVIDCQTCDEEMDCLAELVAEGYDPRLLLPAVQAHLDTCSHCHAEFSALVTILKAQQAGQC